MKILFATPECVPYVKTGGLGDVSAALPATLARLGHDVRILLPAYAGMKVEGEMHEAIDLPPLRHWPEAQLVPVKLATGVTLLLLSCPTLYDRAGGPYVTPTGQDHHDNALRFAFFSRIAAAIGTPATPCHDWQADVVHANDWPAGLAPLYLREWRMHAARMQRSASVITIHNIAFQGNFPFPLMDTLEIPPHWRGMDGAEFWGQLSMLKAALQCADAITTVSPTYAQEICTDAFGVGLQGVLQAQRARLTGILNGIDTAIWNPQTDTLIARPYGPGALHDKAVNKAALQQRLGLAVNPQAMVFGVVSRLTPQKGIDLVLGAMRQMLDGGAQLAVLGAGDASLQDALQGAAHLHPQSVHVTIGFDEPLAHAIEAGADSFLMPSRFEPCGLNQMYSQAYGTPPLVNATGGLRDSVVDADEDDARGTGFVMHSADAHGIGDAIHRAMRAYEDKPRWERIQRGGMLRDFGWERSAAQYEAVYERAIAAARA